MEVIHIMVTFFLLSSFFFYNNDVLVGFGRVIARK